MNTLVRDTRVMSLEGEIRKWRQLIRAARELPCECTLEILSPGKPKKMHDVQKLTIRRIAPIPPEPFAGEAF